MRALFGSSHISVLGYSLEVTCETLSARRNPSAGPLGRVLERPPGQTSGFHRYLQCRHYWKSLHPGSATPAAAQQHYRECERAGQLQRDPHPAKRFGPHPSGVWWEIGWDASKTLSSGTYTFSATIDGQTEQVSLNVDASATLARPTVTIGNYPTTKSVSATWTASSGATAYLVRLVNRTTSTVVARNITAASAPASATLT